MAPSFKPLDQYRNKLYLRESSSKRFLDLTEEQLSALAKKVYRRLETMEDSLPKLPERMLKSERYQRTLQYLTNPYIKLELKTFDERIAYLIMMTDPNLVTFKEFLKIDLINLAEIDKVEDEEERNNLKKIRSQTIASYECSVREKIGFYDARLLKHEEMFFKRFFNEKELITKVGNIPHDSLMIKARSLKDFNNISDERYNELSIVAQTWLSLAPEEFNSKAAAYSVTNQSEALGLNTPEEQLTLFILLIDSNLDILRIYEEESVMQNIERRIIEQFGYFNTELFTIERKFHDRFCPNKKLSAWTKIKKD